jgi:hypothetical protein
MVQHVFWKQLEEIGATGCKQGEFKDMPRAVFKGEVLPVVDDVIGDDEITR